MNIHEYQAKAVLKEFGVPVPRGKAVFTADEAEQRRQGARRTGLGREIADPRRRPRQGQVQGAGRRRQGRRARRQVGRRGQDHRRRDARQDARHRPDRRRPASRSNRLYIEEGSDIAKEFYLSLLVDRETSRVAFVVSTEGGMDIEKVAHDTPEKILTFSVDPATGVHAPSRPRAWRARSA